MSEGKSSKTSRSAFSKQSIVGALAALVALAAGVQPFLKDVSMTGASRLLAMGFAVFSAGLLVRHVVHIADRYYRPAIRKAALFELAVTVAIGAMTWMLLTSPDPQIPRLAASGAVAAGLFLWSAGTLEDARSAMVAQGVAIRRASDFWRASWVWRALCKLTSWLHFGWIERLRKFFGGPDTPPGKLSLMAAISSIALVVIGLISTGLVIASVIFPIQITPDDSDRDGPRAETRPSETEKEDEGEQAGSKEVSPTDTEECSNSHDAGVGVPEPAASALRLGWEGVDGTEPDLMEALGFEIAGCPGIPRPIRNRPGWWYEPGYCGGELRAIVIAPLGLEHPIVLLEQAATFGLPIITGGHFVNAVDRFEVGGGDAYIIDSDEGSSVLIRDHTTAGVIDEGSSPGSGCAAFTDTDVRYTVVRPELFEAWRFVSSISVGGAYPIGYARSQDGSEWFDFRSPRGIVAKGSCVLETMVCTIDIDEPQISGQPGDTITKSEVKTLVEP